MIQPLYYRPNHTTTIVDCRTEEAQLTTERDWDPVYKAREDRIVILNKQYLDISSNGLHFVQRPSVCITSLMNSSADTGDEWLLTVRSFEGLVISIPLFGSGTWRSVDSITSYWSRPKYRARTQTDLAYQP
jgi:hypothetical protein